MSKGSITDFEVKVKPSSELVDFIKTLDSIEVMPENIIKIFGLNETENKTVLKEVMKIKEFTKREIDILKTIQGDSFTADSLLSTLNSATEDFTNPEKPENFVPKKDSKRAKKKTKTSMKNETKYEISLGLNDLRWLNQILEERRKEGKIIKYFHEFMQGCEIILPENELIPRNPELEARCRKLKDEQDMREYRNMTKNVDNVRQHVPDDTIGSQLKMVNRQLLAILQFIFSVAAGFAFGFWGVELIIGGLDFGFRLLLGIICALIIALAEIYFLAKKLSEYDEFVDTQPTMKKVHTD